MALAQIDSGLKSYENGYAASIHRATNEYIGMVADRLRFDSGVSILQSGQAPPMRVGPLMNDLLNRRHEIANFGRGQVTDELKRQINAT